MAKIIPLSFKETERDMKIYLSVIEQGNKSNFIKDALEFYIKYGDKKELIALVEKLSSTSSDKIV